MMIFNSFIPVNVYNFRVKMTDFASRWIALASPLPVISNLEEKVRELLDKNGKRKKKKKRKEKGKLLITWLDQKRREILRVVAQCFFQTFNRSTRCEWRSTIFEKCLY